MIYHIALLLINLSLLSILIFGITLYKSIKRIRSDIDKIQFILDKHDSKHALIEMYQWNRNMTRKQIKDCFKEINEHKEKRKKRLKEIIIGKRTKEHKDADKVGA